ncbi:hypothetical protein J7I93_01665 [Bacillus sp. ISL-47]|nr:hypothetical protein [Bacillus sp. ISL-47]MBT2686882.1 hypothetical protein [Bacillus sp. ISL-47]MBT2706763.1 hypothetical protein [Pseudomonas sp. ISL-84]
MAVVKIKRMKTKLVVGMIDMLLPASDIEKWDNINTLESYNGSIHY